jgi:hypothetical protein
MSMGESHENGGTHANMTESMESILGFSVDFCFGLFFSLSVHRFSPHPDVSFLSFLLIYAIFSGSASWFSTLWQFPRVPIKEPHDRGRIA